MQYNAELSAFNLYRTLLQYSTPKSSPLNSVRKPRVNFHSIDDIVNGGKSNGMLKKYILTLNK